MSTTVALNTEVTDKVLGTLPENVHDAIIVRAASINEKTGRCLFDFEGMPSDKIAVAVVCKNGKPTKRAYVIPGGICPVKLFVRPGGTSKWDVYLVSEAEKLTERIVKTVNFQPNKALLKKL